MKKLFLIPVLLILCLLLTGCEDKEVYIVDLDTNRADISDENIALFEKALGTERKPIALLATQVVSGMNYMFLTYQEGYKVDIVYQDLEGNVVTVSDKEFDMKKYAGKKIEYDPDDLIGGWNVEIPTKKTVLKDDIQKIVNEAIKKETKIKYFPGVLLGHSENTYVVLAYGEKDEQQSVYVLTINKNKKKITASAYVDLTEFYY